MGTIAGQHRCHGDRMLHSRLRIGRWSIKLPIDNNHDEQQIRPWATGRKNLLFAGSLLAGQRAAPIMSLIQSAKLNGHDTYAYLKDLLARLPTHRARDNDALPPHLWTPAS